MGSGCQIGVLYFATELLEMGVSSYDVMHVTRKGACSRHECTFVVL